jgi:outer membrane protein assembly factor BamB
MPTTASLRLCTLFALLSFCLVAADWPQFRGPGGKGVSDATGLPTTWDASTNLRWKTKLAGPGASSPVVVGESVFVTSYGGYGLSQDDPGDEKNLVRYISCYRLADGSLEWRMPTKPQLPEIPYRGFQALHGYASSTLVSDGQSLFAFLGKSGVGALSIAGKPLWAESVGTGTNTWGSGTSPLLHNNLVIVNASVESTALVALNKADGTEVWRVKGIEESWSTPALAETPDGSTELVVSLKNKILGLDPQTGDELWQCQGVKDYVCPAVLAHAGVVYIIGGRKATAIAIRTGGRGNITDTDHHLWEANKGSNVSSPVYHDGHLYWASEGKGIAYCVNAETGEIVYQERLDPNPGRIYASPLLADGKIYHVSREKGVFIVAASPEFEMVSRVEPMDDSIHNASFSVGAGNLLLRSNEYLYCIGQ